MIPLARKPYSLTQRLLISIAIALLVSLGAIGWALDHSYADRVRSSINERLASSLILILASIEEADDQALLIRSLLDNRLNQPDSGWTAGLITQSDIWTSPSLMGIQPLTTPLSTPGQQLFELRENFYPQREKQFTLFWQLSWEASTGNTIPIILWSAADYSIYLDELWAYRKDLWRWLGIAAVILLAFQLLVFALGIRPLRVLVNEAKKVEQGKQSQFVESYPGELQKLTDNLNAMLHNEHQSQQRYRKALGNLAHSIKTPLTVLQNVIQNADLSQNNEQIAGSALAELNAVMRYQLERAASAARKTLQQPIDVLPDLRKLCNAMRKVHPDNSIELNTFNNSEVLFQGEQRDFLELAGNLIENACKYGNHAVRVDIEQTETNNNRRGLLLTVSNDGVGLTEASFERYMQRGIRGDERIEGHGLGLSIVAEIVDTYGAEIELVAARLGGTSISVRFPASHT